MAERDSDVGKPLFKKRAHSGRHAQRVSASESLQDDDASAQGTCVAVDELVSLRDMLRKPTGIELTRLNAGDRKRRRKMDGGDQSQDQSTSYSEIVSLPPKVDRHMYVWLIDIRSQFVKANSAKQDTDAPSSSYQSNGSPSSHSVPAVCESNNACNAALLTSVPEVDLGLQPRLENIEATEKAKRALMQHPIPTPPPDTEPSTLDEARKQVLQGPKPPQAARKERASDDRVYKRFRQRIQR